VAVSSFLRGTGIFLPNSLGETVYTIPFVEISRNLTSALSSLATHIVDCKLETRSNFDVASSMTDHDKVSLSQMPFILTASNKELYLETKTLVKDRKIRRAYCGIWDCNSAKCLSKRLNFKTA